MGFDDHFIDYEGFDGKFDPYGGFGILPEYILGIFGEDVGLADTRIPNDYDFEHEVGFDVAGHV